jgi:hypothetical protein
MPLIIFDYAKLHQLIQVINELAAFMCLTHESSSLYSFQGSRDAATIASESNAMSNSVIEVRSLKAEQYSPFLRSTFVHLRMTETPTEGAAKRYDLWPYTRDEW